MKVLKGGVSDVESNTLLLKKIQGVVSSLPVVCSQDAGQVYVSQYLLPVLIWVFSCLPDMYESLI